MAHSLPSIDGVHYDCAIIGSGMSGLAAGIRLAQFGKKIIILEKHNAPGGLNSFYSINGRKYDVGLHALTNCVEPGIKGTALSKILRQLRINRDEWDLNPQRISAIRFSEVSLGFTNDIEFLKQEIRSHFPNDIDGFELLVTTILSKNANEWLTHTNSSRKVLGNFIKDPLLIEMLLCPILFYGSPQENDIPWGMFTILFCAILLEGFGRPYEGIRVMIRSLLEKLRSLGAERRMKCGVKRICSSNDRVDALQLDTGETITADYVLSSAGFSETMALCDIENIADSKTRKDIEIANSARRLSFVETISIYKQQPQDWGWNETIIFFNEGKQFTYEQPNELVDLRSGVICIPNNYNFSQGRVLSEGIVRITALANYKRWTSLPETEYRSQKEEWFKKITQQARRFLPKTGNDLNLSATEIAQDMFTPRTVHKFTYHLQGSVYGCPRKTLDGTTPLRNLFIIGSDQGLVGVTGTLMSGIMMANRYVLRTSM